MAEIHNFRALSLPAKSRDEFVRYLQLPFDQQALEFMHMPVAADDIIIATFPKSGTTWTQQICHGLRSNGDMDFKEISWVAPWLERGHMFGIDTRIPQAFAPRVFKTHLPYAQINKGARYIHVIRDPKDILVSFYNFLSHGIIDPASISIEIFAEAWLLDDQLSERRNRDLPFGPYLYNYWRHLLDWWSARKNAPVLTLVYEHMCQDLALQVAKVATFMGIEPHAGLLALATHQASFAFMEANKDKFSDEIIGIPHRLQKVVRGQVGSHKQAIDRALAERIDAAWRQYVEPATGSPSYDAFIADLA